jgi:type I restriction enzyme S subunit
VSGRDGWKTVPLCDVLALNRESNKVVAGVEYPNLGLYSFGRGAFEKAPIEGGATSATTLYRVRSGQFIYSRLFAFEGAFSVVPAAMDGWFVSNEYPTFDIDSTRVLPEFLELAICRPSTWHEMASLTIGMGHRRQRLHPEAFLSYEIELPPLDDQCRIFEAVGAIGEVIRSYAAEGEAALELLGAAREERLADKETRRLGDLLERIEAGKSPKALDRPPIDPERGVLKVSAVRPGEFRPFEAKAVREEVVFPKRARVRMGDVLITRANTRQLVGAVCRVHVDSSNLYLSDKTLRLVPSNALDPDFLVHALASSVAREQIEEAASGSSESMKNISRAVITNLEVPLPDSVEEQRTVARMLDSLRRAAQSAVTLRERAVALRSSVIESFLSGERSVRASTERSVEEPTELSR